MRVVYSGEFDIFGLTEGKEYPVMSIERKWYRIPNDFDEDYLYPPNLFVIVEESADKEIVHAKR